MHLTKDGGFDGWVPDNVASQVEILREMMISIEEEDMQNVRIRKIACLYRFLNDTRDKYGFTARSLLHCGEIHKSMSTNGKSLLDQAQLLTDPLHMKFVSEAQYEIEKFLRLQ